MGDEYSEISNKELLSLCLLSVKENLEVQKNFSGFYQSTNIKSETTVNAIKAALFIFNLQLENCRGQTYADASNMLEKKSGVDRGITTEQPKARTGHCYGYSLRFTVKRLTSSCKVLGNIIDIFGEICFLIKFSLKRENLLGTIWEQVERKFDDENDTNQFRS